MLGEWRNMGYGRKGAREGKKEAAPPPAWPPAHKILYLHTDVTEIKLAAVWT